MYTTQPLVSDINEMRFIVFMAVCGFSALAWFPLIHLLQSVSFRRRELPYPHAFALVILLVVTFFAGTFFLIPANERNGRIVNKPVEATLIDDAALGEVTQKVSKHKRETVPELFVFYMTPDGPVSFRRMSGATYAQKVVLYWNPTKEQTQ